MTAEDIDQRTQQESGWTRRHTGVGLRYECRAPESVLTMGMTAIQTAMQRARVAWSDINLLIDCSTSRYRPIPCNAAHYLQLAGKAARSIPCFDVQSTCLGFLVGLQTANALLGTGDYRHIILVASEAAMAGVNWQQPESAGLIGDGAAAVVLKREAMGTSLLMTHETFAEHLDVCKVDGGAHFLPVFEYTSERRSDYLFDMNGPAVFRVAISRLPRMVRSLRATWESLAENSGQSIADMHVVPHQASPGALDVVRRMLDCSQSQFHCAAHEIGNMAAASIPFMLDRCLQNNLVPRNKPLMLLGTSAGYSQAAMILDVGDQACS